MSKPKPKFKAAVQSALQSYDLDWTKIRFYAEEDNILYLVYGPDQKYLLKISRPGDRRVADYKVILHWMEQVQDDGHLKPIPTKTGQQLTVIDGDPSPHPFICVLYPWIEGAILRNKLSPSTALQWGELMAKLHTRSEDLTFRNSDGLRTWNKVFYWGKEVLFQPEYARYMPKARRRVFQEISSVVTEELAKLRDSSAELMLIHGDLHPHNIKCHQGELHALDFDDCMWGYAIQDIAIALMYIRHLDEFPSYKQAFREGYSRRRRWPEARPGQMEIFFMARLLWIANEVLATPDDDEEEDHQERLERYEEEFEAFLRSRNA